MYNKLHAIFQIFLFLYFFRISQEEPFVYDDTLEYCSYPLIADGSKFIETNSKIFQVNFEDFQISFKLCKAFHNSDICPDGLTACLKYFKDGQQIGLGNVFTLGQDQLKTTNGDKCTEIQNYSLVIHFSQEGPKNPEGLSMNETCTFRISMKLPVYSSGCGTYIFGKYTDLSPLARSFEVHIKTREFRVTLCGSDPSCKQKDVNACELTGLNITTPISLLSTLQPFYNGNEIGFKGFTYDSLSQKHDKKFTVLLKCNWDKNEVNNNDMIYNKVPTQGDKYSFELETSYGCLIIPKSCVVKNGFLVYNLTGLTAEYPVAGSTIEGSSRNNSFFIQMCGAVDLKGKNGSCKRTYTQVCQNINSKDVNRGSELSELEVINDVVVVTIDNGAKCYDHNQNVSTHHKSIIHFFCDSKDYEPKIVPSPKSCEMYFHWKTPKACPEYDITTCIHIKQVKHSCKFYSDLNYYDLNLLTSTKVITDRSRKLEFKFNACGSVLDLDAPCTKDVSIVMKNLSHPNRKFRFISLGKYWESTVTNNNLVLKFRTGGYCDRAEGDYRSEIHFECSSTEEEPILRKKEMCYYEFLWKTPKACPLPLNEKYLEDAPCIFTDHINMKSFNFGNIKALQFSDLNNMTFEICSKRYRLCPLGTNECPFVKMKNITAVFTRAVNKLEIMLDKNCNSSNDFNNFTLVFFCTSIGNNHHFGDIMTNNCSLTIPYFTDVVCPLKVNFDSNSMMDSESSKENVLNDLQPAASADKLNVSDTCHLKSPYTQREVNIENLPNDVLNFNCPIATFNNTFRFVNLTYFTGNKCLLIPSKNISYDVYLICPSTLHPTFPSTECRLSYYSQNSTYCHLFTIPQTESSEANNILLIVGVALAGVFFVGLMLRILWKWNISVHRSESDDFVDIYEKDTEV